MPRPDKKQQRKEQFLKAMGAVVAKFGLAGATQDRVAAEAGLARALLRHNVGNRETLISEFIDYYLKNSEERTNELFDSLLAYNKSNSLIEILFDEKYADPESVLIAEALIAASANDVELAIRMKHWTMEFIENVQKVLRQDFPQASPDLIDAVAAGVTGIYFNVESMTPLGQMNKLRNASKKAAEELVKLLA